jgi:hypothetical protein
MCEGYRGRFHVHAAVVLRESEARNVHRRIRTGLRTEGTISCPKVFTFEHATNLAKYLIRIATEEGQEENLPLLRSLLADAEAGSLRMCTSKSVTEGDETPQGSPERVMPPVLHRKQSNKRRRLLESNEIRTD